jgi:hypothetical protein
LFKKLISSWKRLEQLEQSEQQSEQENEAHGI